MSKKPFLKKSLQKIKMMNTKVEEFLNRQIDLECYSSHLYLAMASWAENSGFEGTAKWLYAQADEERLHMLKIVVFVNERGGKAVIPSIKQPPADYENVKKCFQQILDHEYLITNSIHEIVATCIAEKDFTTNSWVQWFVNEQIQEEKAAKAILDKLNMLGEHNMYIFDRDVFGMRAAAEPAIV